jgi:hypothetical protein
MPWLTKPRHLNDYKPGSASLNDSEWSNSESWSMSQHWSHVFTLEEEINPSAIKSSVSSHGQKYSPQCLQRISMASIIRVRYQQSCSIRHPLLGLCDPKAVYPSDCQLL